MAAPAIAFCDVTKTYQRRFAGVRVPALSQISFEVARGEVCAFLGPNGAGKTTSMILTRFHADQGRSRVLDYAPGDVRAKERIGFLPENFAVLIGTPLPRSSCNFFIFASVAAKLRIPADLHRRPPR